MYFYRKIPVENIIHFRLSNFADVEHYLFEVFIFGHLCIIFGHLENQVILVVFD